MKIAVAEGDFKAVARTIAKPKAAPEWLPLALSHYAVWLATDTSDWSGEFDKRIRQMEEAVRVLRNSLPMWENAAFDVACPPSVKMVLEGLPGLQAELDRLKRKGVGRKADTQKEICAAIVIEAWRIIHGRVEGRSDKLYGACRDYWAACGGPGAGATDDIDNWRRTVKRALRTDHSWIRNALTQRMNSPRVGAAVVHNSA